MATERMKFALSQAFCSPLYSVRVPRKQHVCDQDHVIAGFVVELLLPVALRFFGRTPERAHDAGAVRPRYRAVPTVLAP